MCSSAIIVAVFGRTRLSFPTQARFPGAARRLTPTREHSPMKVRV